MGPGGCRPAKAHEGTRRLRFGQLIQFILHCKILIRSVVI